MQLSLRVTGSLSVVAWGQKRKEKLTTKGHKSTWGGENVVYLDCHIGYTGVYICQKALNLYA